MFTSVSAVRLAEVVRSAERPFPSFSTKPHFNHITVQISIRIMLLTSVSTDQADDAIAVIKYVQLVWIKRQ